MSSLWVWRNINKQVITYIHNKGPIIYCVIYVASKRGYRILIHRAEITEVSSLKTNLWIKMCPFPIE